MATNHLNHLNKSSKIGITTLKTLNSQFFGNVLCSYADCGKDNKMSKQLHKSVIIIRQDQFYHSLKLQYRISPHPIGKQIFAM